MASRTSAPPAAPDGALPSSGPDALRRRDASALIDFFRGGLAAGQPWIEALLDTIARWDIAEEAVEGRPFRYLIGGEAFDWLLLAERICDAVRAEGLLPGEEVEALLYREQFPRAMTEDEFRTRLGPAKSRAHLNFLYGVRVEEALHLAVTEQVHKERLGRPGRDHRVEEEVFQRIYGETRLALLQEFRQAQGQPWTDRTTLLELRDFTYWCFKRRVARQEPARVASDTRRGLLLLQQLEEWKRRRWRGPEEGRPPAQAIDVRAIPVP